MSTCNIPFTAVCKNIGTSLGRGSYWPLHTFMTTCAKEGDAKADDDSDDDIEVVEADDTPKEDSKMSAKPSNGTSSNGSKPLKKRVLEEQSEGNGAKKAKLEDEVEVIELE